LDGGGLPVLLNRRSEGVALPRRLKHRTSIWVCCRTSSVHVPRTQRGATELEEKQTRNVNRFGGFEASKKDRDPKRVPSGPPLGFPRKGTRGRKWQEGGDLHVGGKDTVRGGRGRENQ